jgi:BolA protein
MIEEELKDILSQNINCKVLEVINESHLHAGHSGSPETGQSHFHIHIVSDDFKGLSRVEQHKIVNQLAFPLFDKGLHALSLHLKVE